MKAFALHKLHQSAKYNFFVHHLGFGKDLSQMSLIFGTFDVNLGNVDILDSS